jgi:hypothetical protein
LASLRSPFGRGWSRQLFVKVFGLGILAVVATLWISGKGGKGRKPAGLSGARSIQLIAEVARDLVREPEDGASSHETHPQAN